MNCLLTNNIIAECSCPASGGHDDNAHPPIHPTKWDAAVYDSCSLDEQRLYIFIVKHFLACCSEDAVGQQTTIHASMKNEEYGLEEGWHATGLMITARNYLDIYDYDKW